MTAGRALVRNTEFIEAFCKILNLVDTCAQVFEFCVLVKPDSECLHVAAVHTAVGEICPECGFYRGKFAIEKDAVV